RRTRYTHRAGRGNSQRQTNIKTQRRAMERDVDGDALYDYHGLRELKDRLRLHSSCGDVEETPVAMSLRAEADFPELEHIALALCDGYVLDVGAGVGSHALYLQEKGFRVDALEISASACSIMEQRGVHHIIRDDFFALQTAGYDTLLFLMNGIG